MNTQEAEDPRATERIPLCSNNNDKLVAECAILDAFHHEPTADGLKDKWRLKVIASYHSVFFKTLLRVAAFGLLLLPLGEVQSSFTKSTNYLKNEEASVSPIGFWTFWTIELFLILILTVDVFIRGWILLYFCWPCCRDNQSGTEKNLVFKPFQYITYVIYVVTLALTWTILFMSAANPHLNALILVRQIIRPVFLIIQVTMLKKALWAMFHAYTTVVLIGLFVLFFLVPLFFMIIGFAAFPHLLQSTHFDKEHYVADPDTVNEGKTYFNSSAEAYWNLIVYISTANSPDFATPAYDRDRLSFLFFGIYYFLEGYLILKVLTAGYAIEFNNFIEESMQQTYEHRTESFEIAYEKSKDSKGKLVCSTIEKYATKLSLVNEDEFKNLVKDSNISDQQNLDRDKFVDILFDIVHKTKKPFNDLENVEYKICKCCCRQLKVLIVFIYIFSLVIALVQFITLTCLLIIDYNDSFTEPHSPLAIASLAFSILLVGEFFLRAALLFIKTYFHFKKSFANETTLCAKEITLRAKFFFYLGKVSKRVILCYCKWFFCGHCLRFNKSRLIFFIELFDLLLVLALIFLGFWHADCLNEGTYQDCDTLPVLIDMIQATIIIIVFRMIRMLAEIPLFGMIIKSLIRVLVVLVPFLLLGYLFYYEFAVIGMAIFRVVNLNDTEAAAECDTYEKLKYQPYNFEDFGSTLVLLWNLMIVNNWHVIVEAYVRRTSIYSRIYFVIWWVFSETVLNGILLGYLIETVSVTKTGLEDAVKINL
ncbi:PREDICTED: two pore calcium channel protein 2-like [Amphimedon queenslandica]|uniref:Ion transport domain-containing protein n=1 Tax=Amphimedon queenslandica TaxID=400682 RepID=A0A1X7T0J8_AMPQE|nr:PREDICTED: two pore calcium channel protein 2-like [Amphimedon queenslandica]|eukprot:XP_011408472.1 PREDICTED: two pore calcium channel protein 2-like [Amphimedon queenslandica]